LEARVDLTLRESAIKSWEIIADNLKKAGWSYGYVSALDREKRRIWIADAHHGDGKRFVVHADEKLTAFLTGCGLLIMSIMGLFVMAP